MLHQGRWQVDIADVGQVIECEAARHYANDGVGRMIQFQRLPDHPGIAAKVALPEAVVKNNNGVAAVLRIGWLNVAAEKRAHTEERPSILREVGARDLFGLRAGNLHLRGVKAKY